MSLGYTKPSVAEEAAINDLLKKGIIVVAASGNANALAEVTQLMYPAAYPSVLSVAAINCNYETPVGGHCLDCLQSE